MNKDRMFFKDNPWPEGHPLKEFIIEAKIIDEDVWFHIYLETEDYSSERNIEDNESEEYPNSWGAPPVWDNYHSCHISTEESDGFKVCHISQYSKEYLNGLKISVDSNINFENHEWDDFTFQTYLLGHDAVTDHHFLFERQEGTELFNISWTGKIALAYAGDYTFKHEFQANLFSVVFPKLETMV